MHTDSMKQLKLPESHLIRDHVVLSLNKYWPEEEKKIKNLPVKSLKEDIKISLPLELVEVKLPKWSKHSGVGGLILVPREAVIKEGFGDKEVWENIDWFLACFLLMECWHERVYELNFGPIHSYSFRLKRWDQRVWDRAWVNRICIFFLEWHNYMYSSYEAINIPKLKISMTHDVDAIDKTLAIVLKQTIFNSFNLLKALLIFDFKRARFLLTKIYVFVFKKSNWWLFDEVLFLEQEANIKSIFNFYADIKKQSLKSWLMNPSYKLDNPRLRRLFKTLKENGNLIGLHPAYDSWKDSDLYSAEREILEEASSSEVRSCRQHWLRFSWSDTWIAQQRSGLLHDSTLMFNDRPGFRASCIATWRPWDVENFSSLNIEITPSIMMDSHFYDYNSKKIDVCDKMEYFLEESNYVGGDIYVLWHTHTLSEEYGWRSGFKQLLKLISNLNLNK